LEEDFFQGVVSVYVTTSQEIADLKKASEEEQIKAEDEDGETQAKNQIRDGGTALFQEAKGDGKITLKNAGLLLLEGAPKAIRAGGVDALRATVLTMDQAKNIAPPLWGSMMLLSRFNAITSAAFCAAELTYLSVQCYRGKLTVKQFVKKGVISVVANCGAWAGAALGALLGSFIPGFGTVIGAGIGGFVGAVASSYILKKGIEHFTEKEKNEWSDAKQFQILHRDELFKRAIYFFHLTEYCTKEEATEARRRYFRAYHPDKPGGVGDKFYKAFQHYAIIKMVREEQNWAPKQTWWERLTGKSAVPSPSDVLHKHGVGVLPSTTTPPALTVHSTAETSTSIDESVMLQNWREGLEEVELR